jgi:hypothetical protein
MTAHKTHIEEGTYFRIMPVLEENLDLTQRKLAERLRIGVRGFNYF